MDITLYPKYLIRSLFAHDRHDFFKAGYKLLYPEYGRRGMTPWQHYVVDGKRKGYGNGSTPSDGIFFREGYELEYPDVKSAGVDAWIHYAEKGRAEGRDNGMHPGRKIFFAEGYLEMYPDVAESKQDPWRHYVLHGKKAGRDNGLHPDMKTFFAEGYLEMYPDVAESKQDPWRHYMLHGKKAGRDNGMHPSEKTFFAEGYLEMYPDVGKSKQDPWRHYVLHGKNEGRDNGCHPGKDLFFAGGYVEIYQDVKSKGVDPWCHYIRYGKPEGRNNGFNDYGITLAGHAKEIVKSIYLSPARKTESKNHNSKKALLVGHEFSLSGAPLSLLGIAKILLSDGYNVDIAVRDMGRTVPTFLYDGIGADVFLLPRSTECFHNADKIIENYDFVIINTILMGAYAELCRKHNIPHLWFVREDLPMIRHFWGTVPGSKQRFFDDYENVVCVSKYVTDCIYDDYRIKYKHINNFIEDRFKTGTLQKLISDDTFDNSLVTFAIVAGTVEKRKAQDNVIAAFLSLSANPKYKGRWKLFFIGKYGKNATDPELGMKLLAVTKGINDIVWVGQVAEDKWSLFEKIDFFIIPSFEEASSRVAIESAMLAKPIIVTNHVGAKYLTDNNAGFVYEPGNIAELRNIIIRCLDMPYDEYKKKSNQIRLNYVKTSSPAVYSKNLYQALGDAADRCHATSSESKRTTGLSAISLRGMCSGGNVVTFNGLDYIKFIDFSSLDRMSVDTTVTCKSVSSRAIGIVIPVLNDSECLKIQIPSLFNNTDLSHKFIFVDDSSNTDTADYLRHAISGRDDCVLISNDKSLGLWGSINKGAEKALESCDNFVILNSFTEVPSCWLSRLMMPIFENENVSAVIPLMNNCSIFSFPFYDKREKNDDFLQCFGLEQINDAIRNSFVNRYVDIPSVQGSCIAISGKAWNNIGCFNAKLFRNASGAELEWGLRSQLDGFRTVLLPGLYVANHEKCSISDKEQKANDVISVGDIISVMFPSYQARLRNFCREYPLSDSFVSIYISLAKQRGYTAENFIDSSLFMKKITSGDDGIFVLKTQSVIKLAVKLLGESILVGHVKNLEESGIYNS